LHQWLVRQGWALNFEPYAKGRYKADQEQARVSLTGLWKGCFPTPEDFRLGNKRKANLLGPSCAALDEQRKRNLLFPDPPAMPPGCTIKGKFALRAQITSHRGIYHMEGCRSYQRTKVARSARAPVVRAIFFVAVELRCFTHGLRGYRTVTKH
jgi:hypothetical protein